MAFRFQTILAQVQEGRPRNRNVGRVNVPKVKNIRLSKYYHLKLTEKNDLAIFFDQHLPFTNFIMMTLEEKDMKKSIAAAVRQYFPVHSLLPDLVQQHLVTLQDGTDVNITQPIRTIFDENKRGMLRINFIPMLTPIAVNVTQARFIEKKSWVRSLYAIPNWFDSTTEGDRVAELMEYLNRLKIGTPQNLLVCQVALVQVTSIIEAAVEARSKPKFSVKNKAKWVLAVAAVAAMAQFFYFFVKFGGGDLTTGGNVLHHVPVPTEDDLLM